jgi:hypothetical protein
MRKRWLGLVAAVAAAALAASAAPAFTADTGTVTVTVTAQAAATPCITVAPTTLDFGTLPFSGVGTRSTRFIGGAGISPTVTNCGTAVQTMTLATSNATGTGGSWTPSGAAPGNPCDRLPAVDSFNITGYREAATTQEMRLTTTPVGVLQAGGGALYGQAPGASDNFGFQLDLPCQGSNGAGAQKSLTLTFTAVVA